ncbi:MAG: acetyl-CoA carboxylase carboxyltransferase subunit beta [Chitinophagaceae bacterium]|nr:acetyl-CoA carboxylase carboxyltransferase subunit beta [Chitinophagaceae bacterium]MBL0056980.1 acetyl-CoA carboxylase carboxyltransferase subunit beta [Chitinophagaceae bacterium]
MKHEEDFDANLAGEAHQTNDSKTSWFKRIKKGILTSTKDKKDAPEGLWAKCPSCKYTCTVSELQENKFVCLKCEYHHRIGSQEYFEILFDNNEYTELFGNIRSKDHLGFVDLKPYQNRLDEAYAKTDIHDSITVAQGTVKGNGLVVACMDFEFIGGSLGSVMGEKISRAVDHCIKNRIPFMIINKSGGARMMESAFSLMQLAKTSGKLSLLSDAGIPYISLCTDPTFGGTTASFAMLGDIICGEPGALIGFAGPRVIKETIKKDLPEGFQRSEFLLEHGFLDFIVHRKELKEKIGTLLELFKG